MITIDECEFENNNGSAIEMSDNYGIAIYGTTIQDNAGSA